MSRSVESIYDLCLNVYESANYDLRLAIVIGGGWCALLLLATAVQLICFCDSRPTVRGCCAACFGCGAGAGGRGGEMVKGALKTA